MPGDNLVALLRDIFESMNHESHYIMILSLTSLLTAPFAVWAGGNLLWALFQPAFTYWNYPSVQGMVVMSAYLLAFAICWTIVGLFELKLAFRWRVRIRRLREANNSILRQAGVE